MPKKEAITNMSWGMTSSTSSCKEATLVIAAATSSLTLLRILNVDTSSEGTESNYEDQNLIHLAFCLKV
jgi:hypothetical protein